MHPHHEPGKSWRIEHVCTSSASHIIRHLAAWASAVEVAVAVAPAVIRSDAWTKNVAVALAAAVVVAVAVCIALVSLAVHVAVAVADAAPSNN